MLSDAEAQFLRLIAADAAREIRTRRRNGQVLPPTHPLEVAIGIYSDHLEVYRRYHQAVAKSQGKRQPG
jgi:hypothetical protein